MKLSTCCVSTSWSCHPQTRHNFVGEIPVIRIFSVKICINPYPSFLCIDVSRKRSYRDAVCKQIATLCKKNQQPAAKNQNRSFTSRGATVGLGLHLWLTRSIVLHGRRNLPFFGNLAEKASCVDDKTVLLPLHHLFIICFSVICLKSVSQPDTAVSYQKRPKSVLDTDNPYQVACLHPLSGF